MSQWHLGQAIPTGSLKPGARSGSCLPRLTASQLPLMGWGRGDWEEDVDLVRQAGWQMSCVAGWDGIRRRPPLSTATSRAFPGCFPPGGIAHCQGLTLCQADGGTARARPRSAPISAVPVRELMGPCDEEDVQALRRVLRQVQRAGAPGACFLKEELRAEGQGQVETLLSH